MDIPDSTMFSREVAENARNGPVAAIDTRDEVLDAIRGTRLSDTESCCQRCVLDHAAPTLCVGQTCASNGIENFVAGVDGVSV
jgi:hypothetical protein